MAPATPESPPGAAMPPPSASPPGAAARPRLGERLVQMGLLSAGQLKSALGVQQRTGEALGKVLVSLGFVQDDDLARVLAVDLGVPFVKLNEEVSDPALLDLVPADFARKHSFLPLRRVNGQILVAMANPANIVSIDAIKDRLHSPVKVVAAARREIIAAITRLLERRGDDAEPARPPPAAGGGAPVEPLAGGDGANRAAGGVAHGAGASGDTIALTDKLLDQGLRYLATDIHVEPEEKLLRVRYRIDGVLVQGDNLHKDAAPGVLTRIKILSGLDITERRKPQDGRLKLQRDGQPIDVRVSIMPTIFGENAVLRVLDRSTVALNLDDLGIVGSPRQEIDRIVNEPHGMLLVSGPTGSGKTTTLYALLLALDSLTQKIVTCEDPVEYQLPLVRQSQMDPTIGYGFAEGLKSILRQDPDIILVGEIRDRETAEIALKASLTGHFVLSSIHTNSAVGVVTRLLDLGVDRYLVGSSLTGAMAQRLVRRVCGLCKTQRAANEAEAQWLGIEKGAALVEGKGCTACRGSGCAGRLAVYELFVMDDESIRLLAKGGGELELADHAKTTGRPSLYADARAKVLAGQTTVAEVMRVCKRGAS